LQEQQPATTNGDPAQEAPPRRRQLLIREVNEQIRRIGDRRDGDGFLVVLCECGSPECTDRLTIRTEAYEAVRSAPARFIVKEGHSSMGDHVVGSRDGYVMIQKSGAGARSAAEHDPRR